MKFSIHSVYAQIFKVWRKKRMDLFFATIKPQADEMMLDVGGFPNTWTSHPRRVKHIDCLNVHQGGRAPRAGDEEYINMVIGDGCDLEYGDGSYDVVFSNSVIEHVGDWERQRAFAAEVRRVGKRLWIQTPAFECPFEPHFLAPFIHWLPASLRKAVVRWLTPWGWITRPSRDKVEETVNYTQLLSKKNVKELFPDCTVITERLLGIFPKSYIAYRDAGVPSAATKVG